MVTPEEGLPELPVNAGIVWDLANMFSLILEEPATITTDTQPNAVWFARVRTLHLVVHMSRWCEVFDGPALVLAGQYSTGFRNECARIARLISAPVRRHKKKSQMSISRLQSKMRALHLSGDGSSQC
jgi:hypothetical protein